MNDYVTALLRIRAARPNLDWVEEYGTAVLMVTGQFLGFVAVLWVLSGRSAPEIMDHVFAVGGSIALWGTGCYVCGKRTSGQLDMAKEDMERVLRYSIFSVPIWLAVLLLATSKL